MKTTDRREKGERPREAAALSGYPFGRDVNLIQRDPFSSRANSLVYVCMYISSRRIVFLFEEIFASRAPLSTCMSFRISRTQQGIPPFENIGLT